MLKQTPSAKILVADGQGGMRALEDHRFDERDWPISFAVSAKDATAWMAHLHAECESRGWQSGGLSQLEPEQNSGSLTVHAPKISVAAALEIAWDKSRAERLSVRARPGALSEDEAREFFFTIDARLKNRTTLRQHRRAWLTYDVLPWRGEVWLDRDLRLGRHRSTRIRPSALRSWLLTRWSEVSGGKGSMHGSFNGKLRDECLSLEWFRSRREASVLIEAWRRQFNTVRPHQSLNYLTPIEFKQHHQSVLAPQPRAALQE